MLSDLSIEAGSIDRLSVLGRECLFVGSSLTGFLAADIVQSLPVASTFVIVSDHNVAPLHLSLLVSAVQEALNEASAKSPVATSSSVASGSKTPRILTFLIPPGEASKTRETKAQIEDYMLANKCTRDTVMIALGGGVIGDLAGFVAATFMRGITIIQIPTTLLAMVDSSIGGKTAVDTPNGKNLVGAFHQPHRIYMDTNYLKTLPKRQFVNGMAEVIKTALIRCKEDFELIENNAEQILRLIDGEQDSESEALLKKIILGSARVKAEIVSLDEKEGGLRGLLNFGHSVGHAVEAILAPEVLHGECVAIGMMREAEIARHMGFVNDVAVGRILRCLQAFGLPVSSEDSRIKSLAPSKVCPVNRLLDFMCVDKKNQGNQKKIVMLSGIGKTAEPRATFIPDSVIKKILCSAIAVVPPSSSLGSSSAYVNVPGSKSISNRALVLAALGEGVCRLQGLLHSDDVQVMLDALQKIVGIKYTWENDGATLVVTGGAGRLQVPETEIYLGNAGTASRFLTSVCALIPSDPVAPAKKTVLTGNPRMKQRPIGPLVDALSSNGCAISYQERSGSLPLVITPSGLQGGLITLSASVSSQYVSSILMAAPYASQPVTLSLEGDAVVSQPYIDMTIAMMDSFGIKVKRVPGTDRYEIPKGVYSSPLEYHIEADASSATYPLAFAAITGSSVTVTNIGSRSLQGDSQFAVKVLGAMGCEVEQTETSTTVLGPAKLKSIPSIDMETMTDAFLTASVLAAVATEGSSNVTTITGIANQRVKECNRIAAMVEQLAKFGVSANELPDGIQVHGIDKSKLKCPEGGVKCYDDHRIAMSFSILACALPRTGNFAVISEKKCVEKTWPSWWDALENTLKVSLSGVDPEHQLIHQQPSHSLEQKVTSKRGSIILIGMRGAGKSHMGRAVAKSLGYRFVDMDEYLETKLSKTIPKLIGEEGWESFRRHELDCLRDAMVNHPTETIIACGGGVVETPDARKELKNWMNNYGSVVHIKRNIDDLVAFLQKDKTRPAYVDDSVAVWNRRKEFYRECSNFEYAIPQKQDDLDASSDEYWARVEKGFAFQVRFSLFGSVDETRHRSLDTSFFLSLTFPNVSQARSIMQKITAGVDAVELRVDMLQSTDEDFVAEQLSILRQLTDLPVIFTVRTKAQGGRFSDTDFEGMFRLTESAFRWGCEYVDVEVTTLIASDKSRLEGILSRKRYSKIIASFHDLQGELSWISSENSEDTGKKNEMKEVYSLLHSWGDIIKLIGQAKSLRDNFDLAWFTEREVQSLGMTPVKPLIALNMGRIGQISRVLNQFMTPVTHPALPSAAAPGQLSVAEIHSVRHKLGLLPKRQFVLFGSPISQSMSPTLQNTGFAELGLPHAFGLFESIDAESVRSLIQEKLKQGEFGGAAVTIPLKEDVIKYQLVSRVTPSAEKIGAINTLMLDKDNTTLVGDNTDWLGIKACIERHSLCIQPRIGVVLGAGGTARAACFALQQMGVEEIRIWNRTIERAQTLAREFGCKVIHQVDSLLSSESSEPTEFWIVSTIPASAQEGMAELPKLFSNNPQARGVIVDMAYRPKVTPLLTLVIANPNWKVSYGIDALIEQGLEQFERWTGMRAPRQFMEEQVLSRYEATS